MSIFFLVFIALPILTSYSKVLNTPAFGDVTWAWVFAFSQFIMTWALCMIYSKKQNHLMKSPEKFCKICKREGLNLNTTAFALFLIIVLGTLVITYFASKTKMRVNFIRLEGINWLAKWSAIAGDYMSLASFLGIAGAIALTGFDGFFYSIGF